MAFAGYHLSSSEKTVIDTAQSELAHLSRICLTEFEIPCSYHVRLEAESGRVFSIGILSDRCPQIELELYVQNGSLVWLEGKGSAKADLTGYVEPAYSFSDEEDEDEVTSDEGVDMCDADIDPPTSLAAAEAVARKYARNAHEEANSDDEEHETSEKPSMSDASSSGEEEEIEEESAESGAEAVAESAQSGSEEGSEEDVSADSGSEQEESGDEAGSEAAGASDSEVAEESEASSGEGAEEVVIVTSKKGVKGAAAAAPAAAATLKEASKKRKAEKGNEPPAKRADPGPEESYRTALVEELQRLGGRSKIAMLGAKVPRPAGLTTKLGAFLKQHSSHFVCDGNNVELHASIMNA